MIKQVIDGISLAVFLTFMIFLLVIVPLISFGSEFGGKYFPVLESPSIYRVSKPNSYSNGFAWYNIEYTNIRSCELLETTQVYLMTEDGSERVALDWRYVELSEKNNKSYIKNLGIDALNRGFSAYVIVFSHSCHSFWETHTIINIPNG